LNAVFGAGADASSIEEEPVVLALLGRWSLTKGENEESVSITGSSALFEFIRVIFFGENKQERTYSIETNAANGASSNREIGLYIKCHPVNVSVKIAQRETHSALISFHGLGLQSIVEILLCAKTFGESSTKMCRVARYRRIRAVFQANI